MSGKEKRVNVGLLAAILLLVCTGIASADTTSWSLKITPSDTNGWYSAGSVRLGWLPGFTNGLDWMEDAGPVSPAPRLSIATAVVWPSSSVASVFDYRLSNDPPQIYYLSVYYQDGGAGSIDPIRIKITEPSPTRAYPYELGPLVIDYTPDQENWQQVVYTEQNPLPTEGLTFNINGKATYDYNNPDIIITAGTGGDGFAPGPEPPGAEPLPPGGEESGPGLDSPPAGSIAGAKSLGDGESVSITGKVIVADRTQFAGNILYVEEPNRSAGIRVYYTGGDAALGATVDVSGTIYTNSDGERWIDAGSTGVTEATPAQEMPKSLGLNNRALGGGDWEYDSGTGAGQRGVEGG
ncbi:MAG: hypothetical protein HYX78_13030, partial [Armatimonadetes bacterium]|nr:hypothetical protein [Armatimonadota bacterium]